jgi:hypothetical protein
VVGSQERRAGSDRTRYALLWAVLLGLVLMHGGPAAAQGCHGMASATMVAPSAMAEHGVTHPATSALGAVTQATAAMDGTLCVSTPPPRVHVPVPLLLTVLGVGWWALLMLERAGPAFAARRRGPPRAGRSLLLQVCVART